MPDNAVYMQAAYAIAGLLYLGYTVQLIRRRARVRRELERFEAR